MHQPGSEHAPWHESHQPGLIFAFQLPQVTPNFLPLSYPARGKARPGAQVSEGHQSFNSEETRPSSAGELLDTGEAEAELSQAG